MRWRKGVGAVNMQNAPHAENVLAKMLGWPRLVVHSYLLQTYPFIARTN